MSILKGLNRLQVEQALQQYGQNVLPVGKPVSFWRIFGRQFLNPLIYILLAAAAVSLLLSDVSDAIFISIVLLMNGLVGAVQEFSAGKAADALKALEQPHATVIRDGIRQDIDACFLVPKDIVLLEAGSRVPADIRLLEQTGLQCDESLLTGESLPVAKAVNSVALSGAIIIRGRGTGEVIATGLNTEIGRIAGHVNRQAHTEPPLMVRMRRFTRNIGIAVLVAVGGLLIGGWLRGMELHALFMMSVGLAVSAIPEGLPIAISVALAISMRRMARVNVIVRNMPAVEALGSCTMIATDKTGTLTMNTLTVTDICLPDGTLLQCEAGHGLAEGRIHCDGTEAAHLAHRLLHAAVLPNEGSLQQEAGTFQGLGDTVDVALLVAAHKGGLPAADLHTLYPRRHHIPYEPDLKYAASFHQREATTHIFVKGAFEAVLAMCDRMAIKGEAVLLDTGRLFAQKEAMAAQGLRVLAFAEGTIVEETDTFGHHHLVNLVFLGMTGMQDPVRPEVPEAIKACHHAGIDVVMITGDDPLTARVIAEDAGLHVTGGQVVTGPEVKAAEEQGEAALDAMTRTARIYARVEPSQKLSIVLSLARNKHFVAVTGDGINDAPALKHAHVGVAMGRKGTDVARESADIILTDDNFSSIVAGIREGRVAYANIRKVIFMLVSTGAAEVMLFLLAMLAGTPMPLLAVQLLWLNLVTNGIQDVALACEKAEGDELNYPPRKPAEPIFNRAMTQRIIYSTLVMGIGGFALFWWLLEQGHSEAYARNMLLLLFVLFENFQVLNSRSEHQSVFRQPLRRNPFLIGSILLAQGIHLLAMYLPGLREMLHLSPVTLQEWGMLLLTASSLLLVMEFGKWFERRRLAQFSHLSR